MMRVFRYLLCVGWSVIALPLIAQDVEQEKEKEKDFISDFLNQNETSEQEKLAIQCEYSLLYEQYKSEGQTASDDLITAYHSILKTYRLADTLDTSYRIKSLNYGEGESNLNEEAGDTTITFFYNPDNSGKDIGGEEDSEKATACINADFETGNFDEWSMAYSSSGGEGNISPGLDMGPMNGLNGNHAIMGPGAGMDLPSGGNIPRVYPNGGEYSMRLGDQGTGYNAAKASYSFTVTSQTELFLYHFAVVLEDPGHSHSEQPFMRVNLTVDGQNIECGEYFQAASGSAPGYSSHNGVSYKPWETASIALTPYMGQVATVEFVTADCGPGGHFGYAYIDAECMEMPSLDGSIINCFNPTVTLDGPPGASDYRWTGPGIIGDNETQSIEVDQGGTYDVLVIPVQGAKCAYLLSTTVTDEMGFVTADFDAVPSEICLGEEIEFIDATDLTPFAGDIDVYDWQFGDGNSANDSVPIHTYTNAGIYSVELSVLSTNGCAGTITKEVRVSPFPVADFMLDSVCQGENSTFQDLSTIDTINGNTISTWEWNFGDGQLSTDQNPSHLYSDENLYDATLIVTSNNGCADTLSKVTAIYPNPVVDFSPTEVCLGFETNFNDESTVSNDNTSNTITDWIWDFADGDSSDVQNPIHVYSSDGIYNAVLTVTTDHNCTATEVIPVTVYPQPDASFIGEELEGCSPICPTISSTSVINSPSTIVAYEWTLSDGSVYESSDSILTDCFENDGSSTIFQDVHLKVTSDQGCIDEHEESDFISIFHNPIADFYYSPDEPNVMDPVIELTNTSLFADTYLWNVEGQDSTSENNPIITFPFDPESYGIELIAYTDEGCSDTISTVVKIEDKVIFYVPNSFTPDNDKFNEVFQAVFSSGYDPQDFSMLIFNRWGELIFETHDTEIGWRGTYGSGSDKQVKEGTYIWKLTFKEAMSDKRHTHSGHVVLLR